MAVKKTLKKPATTSNTPTVKKSIKKAAPKPAVADIASKICPVDEIPEFTNMEIWGRSGTGKTTIAASAPTPILIIDVKEKGTRSVRRHKGVDVLRVTTGTEVDEILWALREGTAGKDYKTVVIDTMTQLQVVAIEHARGGRTGLVSRKTWGEAASLMNRWIIDFRDLEMNTIFLAQDRITREDEEASETDDESDMLLPAMGPAVMPSVATTLNAAVDIVGQTFIRDKIKTIKATKGKKEKKIREPEYCLRIGPHPIFYTKFREDMTGLDRGDIPDVLVDPTFDDIIGLAE